MIPTDKAHADYIRACHVAEADIEIDKYSVEYHVSSFGEVTIEDYSCVIAGILLFPNAMELFDFDLGLSARANAIAQEIAEDLLWEEERDRKAMERYYNRTR
jgi:hypothetical protein